MRSAWYRRLGLAGIAGWLAVGSVGMTTSCASTRDDINRVQPDYILKADLVGDYRDLRAAPEWYLRNLIIGVERTNPFMSDGLQDLMRRVRFDIEEHYLVIRQSYEEIVGTDGHGGYAPNTEQYTIAQGDTLDSIAASFGTKSDTILAANSSAISDPNNLAVGNILTIPGNANTGTIVAMYPITSHFDIKRSYNPATGELTNVIDENTTDRLWYEREYIRVDWSRNLVVDPSMFTFWYPEEFGELNLESVAFYENDPTKPDASNFAEMSTGYFDLTQRWLIKPQLVEYDGWKLPQCLLSNYFRNIGAYVQGTVTCDDQEVVIRSSFMKVPTGDQATDYEVAETNGQQLQIVGTLDLQRFSYDRQYGIVDQTWHQYIQRYNIWQKSHSGTVCGQDNNQANGDGICGGDDVNSVCDLNAKLCTLPYTQRQIRPITFFADPEIPSALLPATGKAVDIWNQALRNAVATAREAECRRADGGDRGTCHSQFFKSAPNNPVQDVSQFNPAYPDVPADSIGNVALFCQNPVVATDDPACGAAGFSVRKGDIRHHMIAWWSNPSYQSPLGVVVWPGDPLTGENVNTMINIFGGTFDHAIPYYRDMIQLVNGDVSPSEFASGVPVQLYGSDQPTFNTDPVRDPSLDDAFFAMGEQKRVGGGMSKAEMDHRISGIHAGDTANRLGIAAAAKGATSIGDRLNRIKAYLNAQGTAGTPGFGGVTEYSSRAAVATTQAQKAGLESKYVDGYWASGFGFSPDQLSDPSVMSSISPLQQLSPPLYRQIHDTWDNHWNNRACMMPDGLENLDWGHFEGAAAYFKAKYPDGQPVADGHIAQLAGVSAGTIIDRVVRGKMIAAELYEPVYTTVVIHEMGHAMSEDHDFSGSWDSPNFFPEYWQLRTNNGKSTAVCDPAKDGSRTATDPDDCMGPRYMDPKTTDELGTTKGTEHLGIEAYGVASVMDYHADSRYWQSGLGQYDEMAAKFIYGRTVEVFDDPARTGIGTNVPVNTAASLQSMLTGDWFYNYTLPFGIGSPTGPFPVHYTTLAPSLNLFDAKRCRPATADEISGNIAMYGQVCAPVPRDNTFLRDMLTDGTAKGVAAAFGGDGLIGYWHENSARGGRVRWPYKYGPSAFANYPHIAVFDQGADFYEVTSDIINWYDFYYLSGFYRRQNREWNPYRVAAGIFGRVYDRVHLLAWEAINDAVTYSSNDPSTVNSNIVLTDDDWERPTMLSMTLLFDMLQRTMLRPEPGFYQNANDPLLPSDFFQQPVGATTGDFQIGGTDARYVDDSFDFSAGYDFQIAQTRIGSHIEKPLAVIGLVDGIPPLSTVARETFLDGRNVIYTFRSAMPDAFDRLIGGALAEDWGAVAPYVDPKEAPDSLGFLPIHHRQLYGVLSPVADPTIDVETDRPAGTHLVDPQLGFRTQGPAAFWTMLLQPLDTDMTLINRMRIWIDGASDQIKIDPTVKMTMYDPSSGTIWATQTFGTEVVDGRTIRKGIGARMIEHANRLLAAAYDIKVDANGLPIYTADGHPTPTTGTTLTVKDATAQARLAQYMGLIHEVREDLLAFGFGPVLGAQQN